MLKEGVVSSRTWLEENEDLLNLLARLLIGGGQFFWPALLVLLHRDVASQALVSLGIPLSESVMGWLAVIYLIAGTLLVAGFWVRAVSAAMILVGILFALTSFPFWKLAGYQEPIVQRFFMSFFLVRGGLVILLIVGAGRYGCRDREPKLQEGSRAASIAELVGRVLIALVFLWSAFWEIAVWEYREAWMDSMPVLAPRVLLTSGIAIQLIAGGALLLGVWKRSATLLLIFYVGVVLLFVHTFWIHSLDFISAGEEAMGASDFYYWHPKVSHFLRMKFFADHAGALGVLLLLLICPEGRYRWASIRSQGVHHDK